MPKSCQEEDAEAEEEEDEDSGDPLGTGHEYKQLLQVLRGTRESLLGLKSV